MKKYLQVLFVSVILLNLTSFALASTSSNINNNLYGNKNYNGKSFTFSESGITFSVFQNGEFDFYINNNNVIQSNANFGSVSVSYNAGYNYDAYLQYDDYGAIVQIENVPIYYDNYGKVRQIGNIRINYYSNRVSRIGGLNLYYNSYGYYSYYTGYINSYNRYYAYNPYDRYFVHPSYYRGIVSYNPYRHNYYPKRHDYYPGRYGYNKHSKYYGEHNSYKKIESKVRYAESHDKRNNDRKGYRNSSLASNNNRINNRSNTRNNVRSNTNNRSNPERRVAQSRSNTRSYTAKKRTVNYRNDLSRNTKQSKEGIITDMPELLQKKRIDPIQLRKEL